MNLTNTSTFDEHGAGWSPDDTRIVFARSEGICAVDAADGSNLFRLAASSKSRMLGDPDWRHK